MYQHSSYVETEQEWVKIQQNAKIQMTIVGGIFEKQILEKRGLCSSMLL